MFKRTIFVALLGVAALAYGAGSSINPNVPAANSLVSSQPLRTNFIAAYNDINALIQQNAGPVAPLLPLPGQQWLNTGVLPYVLSEFDGAAWVAIGNLDPVNHIWTCTVTAGCTGLGSPGAAGNVLTSNGSTWVSTAPLPAPTVATANGFAGSVTNTQTAPLITLSVTPSGILQGFGGAIASTTPGYDYSAGTSALATGILKSTTGTGALSIAVAGTDYLVTVPTPASSSLGGVFSIGSTSHQWLSALSTSGTFSKSQPACTDLSNGATGCSTAVGTSGAMLPLLNAANTWGALQLYTNSDLGLLGSSTGYTTFSSANASATNYTLTVPAVTGTLATTGNINTALPSATASQLYGGTAGAGVATPISLSGGLTISGGVLSTPGSPLTLVSTQTASSSASLSWTGLTTTYTSYLLVINDLQTSTTANIYLQFGEGGTPTWETSGYNNAGLLNAGGTVTGPANTSNSGIPVSQGALAQGGASGIYVINSIPSGYTSASGHIFIGNISSSVTSFFDAGAYISDTTAKTAIRLIPSTGTLTSGTASLYAISN